METQKITIPVMADLFARSEKPEFLFWVGCAGAFDDRYKKVTVAFTKILSFLKISFAVLGKEETCTGDPARRAGNELLYQMQAMQNIERFSFYSIKKIITICPHCYNIFKNDYPDLGGNYEVYSYVELLDRWINDRLLPVNKEALNNPVITYHDPCYLGRANGIYNEPRNILGHLTANVVEMKRHKSFALCCGAGGTKEVYMERTEEAITTNASVIATACPFCMNMLTDGIKYKNKEAEIKNLDIAELIVQSLGI
jgi:heterodisulfide reductase subunit D